MLLVDRQLLRQPERHAARDDRHLVNRVRVRQQHREQCVAGFVHGRDPLLFVADNHRPALGTHEHLVLRELEIDHPDRPQVVSRCAQGRFVHQIRKVGPGESRRPTRQHRDIDVVGERNLLGVHAEDAFAPLDIGTIHDDAPIETARPEEGRIEHVRTVGRGDEDDALVRLEAIHLDQQLVERLFALVVPATQPRAAMTPDRVDFVDEDDAGRVLLALLEQVADAGRPDAHEHLHEVGAANRKEGHVGLAGHRARQKGLARPGGAHEQHAFGDAAAELLEFLRLLQELDNLLQLFLGLVDARHVLEGDFFLGARRQLGLALAERQGLVAPALHLAHEEDSEADEQQNRGPGVEECSPWTCRRLLGIDDDAALDQPVGKSLGTGPGHRS